MGVSQRVLWSAGLSFFQLTENWRKSVGAGMTVAVAFIDWKKKFGIASLLVLEGSGKEWARDFGITGWFLNWIKNYLSERLQFTLTNRTKTEILPVPFGIPQGSVLGPTPCSPTIFNVQLRMGMCICMQTLHEVYSWCLKNKLTPHPSKSEAMFSTRSNSIGPSTFTSLFRKYTT